MRIMAAIAAILMTLSVAGCFLRQSAKDEQLTPTPNLMMADIAVPSGFKLMVERSYYHTTSGSRIGSLTYTGRGDAISVLEFFRGNMPISGWTNTRQSGDFGSFVLHFEKANEVADVKVTQGRFSTEFTISISPRGGQSTRNS